MNEKQHKLLYRLILLHIFCLLLAPLSVASNIFSFRNITVEQGLTSNTVNCIFRDSKNFVWLGTANGLNRYDGFNILSFDPFRNKSVVSIVEADSVNLFVASEKELFRYNRKERKSTQLILALDKSSNIKTMCMDESGHLYIITYEGLFKLAHNTDEAIKVEKDKLDNVLLSDIYIDENVCWLVGNSGLIRYDLRSQKILSYVLPTTNSRYLCLTKDDTKLYIATQDNRILIFDTKANTLSQFTTLKSDYILNMTNHNDKLYIGTNGGGLKIVNLTDKSIVELKHDATRVGSISANAIYSVLIDDSSLWVGTFSGGLNYIPPRRNIFKILNKPGILNSYGMNIRSFVLDKKNQGIFGTRNGLIYWADGIVNTFTTDNATELKSNIILSLHPFEGNYLVGTYGGGLSVFEPHTRVFKPFRTEQVFVENSFYSIFQGDNGFIWFGTLSGLIKYNLEEQTYTVFNTSNSGLVKNDIYSIMQDSQGRIWIATREGICYYQNGKILKPDKIDLSFISIVRYLYEDSEQNIWLGCENEGLVKISKDLDSFKQYTTEDFLPDNYISSIIEGESGFLWVTTAKGIACLNTKTSAYYLFSLQDGIPGYAFNDAAVQKTDDNILWWGNEKGLVYLNTPDILNQKSTNSSINITGVSIDGVFEDFKLDRLTVAPEYLNTISLTSSQSSIVVRFSDFGYDYPQSNIYEYKLEGIHEKWYREIGKNEIFIPSISPGTYKLLIRKAGSEEPAKVIIITKPKPYALYIAIATLIIIISIFFLIYKRLLGKFRSYRNTVKAKAESSSKEKYQNIKIEKDELESIKNALTRYMEEEKPYLDPDLKLEDIAIAIQCSKTKISQVLNQYLNTNYSNFVTKYRIEAFKEKAAQGLIHQYTLSALAKECGFSSRSSFFHSMKKLTGQTPLEFLKDAGIDIDKE